ncbi:MAG: deoxyribose-phosphate aldolase [Cytophagaceae bacterium]|nr:deoxyribose-phosphate aldolase [Cytophagaceae bacterium]
MRALIILGLTLIFISCNQGQTADEIIDKAIEAAGGNELGKAGVSFKFRDLYYKAQRDHGKYTLERCTDEACEKVHDILTNDGFKRLEEGEAVSLPDSLVDKYSNSVNSVHYFAALPYGLNSAAVHKELVGMDNVKGKSYYKIKVTFDENGGGEDFQDEYMYWINKETYTVDYLAYNYQVNEGGTRFREAYNVRVVDGIRFVDYNNYKPAETFPPLESLDSLFENNKLELLSKIELEDVEVTPCPSC